MGQRMVSAVHAAIEIDLNLLLEQCEIFELVEPGRNTKTRVVDQSVNASVSVNSALDQVPALSLVTNVGRDD
jgi:hypothetical protein